MPEEKHDPPPPSLLGHIAPDEMLARGMQTVKMTGGPGNWEPPTIEEAARLFPGYEVVKLLGRGGMGAVYQARQIELDRLVAIKLLPLEISVDKDFADRFRREARAMAKLHHSNIITVHDFGTTREGHLFFVMAFVEGANLQDVIRQTQPGLNADQALAVLEQICTALAYAHGKGIVHRDIKPANVMIDTESHVKVADFGLARLIDPGVDQMGHTMTGTVMGTPDYMAPEQMRGMNVDHRADIYSLGVMLYEMLCREVPKGIFDPPSHRTGCDARIDAIVIRAMHQSPDRRYQSTQEMKSDVIAAQAPATPATMVVSGPTQIVQPRIVPRPALPDSQAGVMTVVEPVAGERKSKAPLYAGFAALLIALGIGVFLWSKRATEPGGRSSVTAQTSEGEGGGGKTTANAPSPELGAIALWDTPDKVPSGSKARVEGKTLVLEHQVGLSYSATASRDAVVRASLRLNASADLPQLNLRWQNTNTRKANFYRLQLVAAKQTVELFSVVQADVKKLGDWSLPRKYAADEWVRLEFRAVGDELTVLADGQKLGSVHDRAIMEPGGVNVYANANGYFRDIVYVPLDKPEGADKPGATATTAPTASPVLVTTTAVQTFNGHRYQFVPGSRPWSAARAMAESMGGHLAVISSREEDAWVLAQLAPLLRTTADCCWLGGYCESKGKPWQWVTGEPFAFTAWGKDQPNYIIKGAPGESFALGYVWMNGTAAWNDVGESEISAHESNRGFLVEWDNATGAAAPAAPGSPPSPPPPPPPRTHTAEPWRNVMQDPGFAGSPDIQVTSAGLVFNKLAYYVLKKGPHRDGAIRVRAAFTPALHNLKLVVRRAAQLHYQAGIATDGSDALIQRFEDNNYLRIPGSTTTPLAKALRENDPVEIEFRVVGRKLTVRVNGQIVSEGEDAAIEAGAFGLSSGVKEGPITLQALEYLDLDQAGAPAARPAPRLSASSEPWVDAMGHPALLAKGAVREGAALRFPSEHYPILKEKVTDSAVRMLITQGNTLNEIRLRDHAPSQYRFLIAADFSYITLSMDNGRQDRRELAKYLWPADQRPKPGEPIEFEARAIGPKLTGKINGRLVLEAEDSDLTEGNTLIHIGAGTTLHALETQVIPAAGK